MDYEKAFKLAKSHGQEHIFKFWEDITSEEQKGLLNELKHVDFMLIEKFFEQTKTSETPRDYSNIEPAPVIHAKDDGEAAHQAEQKGIEAISKGEVALFLLAGGLGSRLGFDGPKGYYKATPVMKKDLFQVFAEKILAKQIQHKVLIDWYIMTNPDTHEGIIEYFEKNTYFGLNKEHVILFPQRVLPAVDTNGKLLLKSKHSLFWSPDGTGGFFDALEDHKIISRMQDKKIQTLVCINVDNPLVNLLDEKYIGYHLLNKALMSNKVVEKTIPEERVGLLIKNMNNKERIEILEYTHLTDEDANKRSEEGNLLYDAGNIANYMFNVSFIEEVQEKRLVHYKPAHKKFNYMDATGTIVKPENENGYKFESFVFDCMPECETAMTYMVLREEEFAPIKNAEGVDSPETSIELQTNLAKRWMRAAGLDKKLIEKIELAEISPLFANSQKEFTQKIKIDKYFYEEIIKEETDIYFGDETGHE